MQPNSSDSVLSRIRKITSEEVDFYREHGWVKLSKAIPVALAQQLLGLAQKQMCLADDDCQFYPQFNSRGSRFASWFNATGENNLIRSVSQSRELGTVASTLAGGRSLRWYLDFFFAKVSASSGGARTPWHQDFPYQGWDRGGSLSIWIPLVDCPPEKGTMRFLNGSHRIGPLGRGMKLGKDLIEEYPHLLEEFEMSPPLHLHVGDATIHDCFTMHSAPDNLTDSTRWVYGVTWFPAETLYNGAEAPHNRGRLEIDKPYDDAEYPVIPSQSPTFVTPNRLLATTSM
jgi:hypothetical protein